jgi:lipopolysaccharide export LptBFGC system permease protein LptF
MRGVKLVRRINKGDSPAFVTKLNAFDGRYRMARDQGLEIELSDGQFSQTDCKDENKLLYGSFASYKTMLPFFSESGRARALSQSEIPTLGMLEPGFRLPEKFRVEVASRFALALAPLVFFLVGAPLGVALDKRGRSTGFAISLLIIFFYYGLTISSLVLSRKYPALFPWAIFVPAALTGFAGLWLWKKRLAAR